MYKINQQLYQKHSYTPQSYSNPNLFLKDHQPYAQRVVPLAELVRMTSQ